VDLASTKEKLPIESFFVDVIPEHPKHILSEVKCINDKNVATYMVDAKH
jgi:hypothetical protein